MSVPERRLSQIDDAALGKKLAELHSELDLNDETGPNVIVIWEAIRRITDRNKGYAGHVGRGPYPMPEWVNDYLLRSAEKIGRLWLGIKPEDDRPLSSMNFNEIGELRKVREADGAGQERFRDRRIDRVAVAMGFATKGANAFSRHDRAERDRQYLELADDEALTDKRALYNSIMKNEGIGSEGAVRNRLSKARTSGRRRNPT